MLSTNGSGNLSWVAQTGGGGGSSQARIQFTAASSGTGQTFTDSGISSFTNNTFANVFVNGVLLQTSEYSISGTTLTVSRYLSTGDNVIIAATSPGSVSGTLATTSGGTGLNTYTTGDTLYASASNTLAKLPIGSSGQVLTVSGGIPSWTSPSNVNTSAGTALTAIQTLSSTSETVVLSYALPAISGGSVYTCNLVPTRTGSSTGLSYTLRLRVGSTGTVSDTSIYTGFSQGTAGQPVASDFTITFDTSTSVLRVLHLTSGVSSNGVLGGATTGLTSTYLTLTIQPTIANVPTQYLDVVQASIIRIL